MGNFDANGKFTNPYWLELRRDGPNATTKTLDALQDYLGGWVDDSGRNPIIQTAAGNETRGNASVVSSYKVTGDECWWVLHYIFGSTTSWPGTGAGNALRLVPPFAYDQTFFSGATAAPIFGARASNGAVNWGVADFTGGVVNLYGTNNALWVVNGASSVPFQWSTGFTLDVALRYRISPQVMR